MKRIDRPVKTTRHCRSKSSILGIWKSAARRQARTKSPTTASPEILRHWERSQPYPDGLKQSLEDAPNRFDVSDDIN